MTQEAISFHNITLIHGSRTILDRISGIILQGQITMLVGPSGSGKSTLLSLCNLMRTPTSGEIFIDNREVREWPIRQLRQKVGMVFQTATLFPGTVEDNLLYGVRLHDMPLPNPLDLLRDLGLAEELLGHPADQLSGGQKQRVALGRTLAMQPNILLLDEVTSALDENSKQEVEQTLLHLNQTRQTTLLWVTHDPAQAERMAHTVWHLEDGKINEVHP
jgi:putative ABC transport system ATP-binding protein